jgi:hypothetical protein
MDAFETERNQWRLKNMKLQNLLKQATSDVMYLTQQQENSRALLVDAVHFEMPIQPSKPKPRTSVNNNNNTSGSNGILK